MSNGSLHHLLRATLLAATFFGAGCAGKFVSTAHGAGEAKEIHAVFLITLGDNSADVDAALQKSLTRRGLQVTTGAAYKGEPAVDAVVVYDHVWSWDMTMYLSSLDVKVQNPATGAVIASGRYKNSALHGYPILAKVCDRVLQSALDKAGYTTPLHPPLLGEQPRK